MDLLTLVQLSELLSRRDEEITTPSIPFGLNGRHHGPTIAVIPYVQHCIYYTVRGLTGALHRTRLDRLDVIGGAVELEMILFL